MRRYLRIIKVEIAEDTISALKIDFRVKREAGGTPASGKIDIYNLNQSTETRIREKGSRVMLSAGYGEKPEVVFEGDVRRIERQRENLDRITRVHIGGNVQAQTSALYRRAYDGPESIRTIVADAVAATGLELGPTTAIPEDASHASYAFNGPPRDCLDSVLRPFDVLWHEDNGVIKFTRAGQSEDDRTGTEVSEQSGMIGTPTITENGIRVAVMLNPKIRIDSRITVRSSVIPVGASGDAVNAVAVESGTGKWKVVEVAHAGDNRDGPFQTTIEGRPLEE